jgi:hypothetical protein
VNAYRSLDGGEDIVFTRLSYADAAAGTDRFCLLRATFAGDDQVAGYGRRSRKPPLTCTACTTSGTRLRTNGQRRDSCAQEHSPKS